MAETIATHLDRRLSIAYVVLKGIPVVGGIEKYTEEIGVRLAQRGHRIVVYAMRNYGTQAGMFRGMEIRTVPTLPFKGLEKMTASAIATLAQVARRDCDLVHCHAFGPAAFCGLPRLVGKRTVVQGHGLEWKRDRFNLLGKTVLRLSEIPSVRCPNALTVVSRTQQQYLQDQYGVSSEYIPTGINPPTPVEPELIKKWELSHGSYILFLSRLVREKGAHHLIRAYRRIKTDLKLVIAGDAQHEEEYKQELRNLAEGDPRIIFCGFATGRLLEELFSHCRLFVLPSEIEGMSIALLEAMSYGNCCLVSDIPENLEVSQGHNHTFRSANIDDLACQLERLTNASMAEIADQAADARKHVLQNHTWDAIADKMEAFYRRVLNS